MKISKLILLVVTSISLVMIPMVLVFLLLKDEADRGTFGDMFGVVNALFTGLALAAAGIAVYFQSVELKETKESIAESERRQTENLKAQKQLIELQKLEAIASIKLKQAEITAILQSSGSFGMSTSFRDEINELLERIEQEAQKSEIA
ncbi:hypothetical protein [Vibrio jasicida]|uniref:hypothetical protein n=1 Tax=Vibrio jasicida TaxID=766224 RepID=UPI0005ED6645|nr:hypothetical protein [Vibrio jasicida]